MLEQLTKDRVAYTLRRSHIQNIARTTKSYRLKTLKSQANMNADLSSTIPLSTDILTLLTDYYGVKVIVFELMANRTRAVKTVVIYGGFGKIPPDTPTYMIYNPGVGHFESVRTLGGEYTISYEKADFMREYSQGMGNVSAADVASARAANAARQATPASVAAPAAPAPPRAPSSFFTPVSVAAPPAASVAAPPAASVAAPTPASVAAPAKSVKQLEEELEAARDRIAKLKAQIAAAKQAGKGGRRTRRKRRA
jgi:hypothetical protein